MPTMVAQPTAVLQGVVSPNVYVDPDAFYPATRRLIFSNRGPSTIAGLGSTDSTQLRQTGIISALLLRVSGTLTFGGTITGSSMTWRWPYGLAKAIRLSANGQSNLLNTTGEHVKALEFMLKGDLSDRGVSRSIGAATGVTQGTLSLASEDWGTSSTNLLGPGVTVPATGAYTFDLQYFLPVAADQVSLVGSLFAQSASTQLSLDVDWAPQSEILTLGGSATLTTSITYQIDGIAWSIPMVDGKAVVPDLSQFHQVSTFRTTSLGAGDNEFLLPGTGVGRMLLRTFFNVTQGSTPAPLAMNSTNFGQLAWKYGGSDVPETLNGTQLRYRNEMQTNCDIGKNFGFGMWDFSSEFSLRDVVNEATTSDLRLLVNLVNSPTSPFIEITQETLFAAPVGA